MDLEIEEYHCGRCDQERRCVELAEFSGDPFVNCLLCLPCLLEIVKRFKELEDA